VRGAVVAGEVRFAGAPGAEETTSRDAAHRTTHNDPQGRNRRPRRCPRPHPHGSFGYALAARSTSRQTARLHVPHAWYDVVVFGEIRWTEDSEAHIARHNITPYEVEQALYTRPRLAVPGRENTTEVLGTTTAGRHLLVVVTEAADGRDYIITARDMSPTEKRTFRGKGH